MRFYVKIAAFLAALSVVLHGMAVSAAQEKPPATGPDWAMDQAAAPAVVAEGAILMDIDTGVILYEKNIHEKFYPASITKLLTCLVAVENSELTDMVTFSHQAVFGIEKGSTHVGIDEGEQLTMKDCYYAALLASANEVSSGIAEHVGGSIAGFAAMMNEKVAKLGGSDSHFVNANGLHDDDHYTSAYDMALIAQAFAKNETLLAISGTDFYHINATAAQPDEIDLRNHHRMLPGCQLSKARPYEYVIGGKTGYTTKSMSTLVTFAKKGGQRLLCVVLKDTNPEHYIDTLALLQYGFACYENPQARARIDEKAAELLAQQPVPEEEDVSGGESAVEAAGAQVLMRAEEPDGQADAPDGTIGTEESEPKEAAVSGLSVLTVAVILVVLAAAAVCGAIFYQGCKRERERARRRAEIIARHRARREADAVAMKAEQ